MSRPARKPLSAHTPTSSLFFFSSLIRRQAYRRPQNRQRQPRGSPARVMPSPGTALRKRRDLRAVKPPRRPSAPQRQLASERSVPSPQLTRSWSHTSYSATRLSTSHFPSAPQATALTAISPMTHRLLTNRESWSTPKRRGRQAQNGVSVMRAAQRKPVGCWRSEVLEMAKQWSTTFSGSCCCWRQRREAAAASSRERYFLPGLYLTPYSTISSFWMVRGSFSSATLASKVRGQATAPPAYGLRSRFSMSRLISSELMLQRTRTTPLIIIIATMPPWTLLLSLLFLLRAEDVSRFWLGNGSSVHALPQVPRVLFVSAWDGAGRRAAIAHARLFETVVLCLYDLRFADRQFRLQKLGEVEPSFMRDLREANPAIRVLLRVYVVGSARGLFEYVSSSTKRIAEVAAGVVRAVRREKAGGVYFDSPLGLGVGVRSGPYDKFAALLNTYIANKIRELLWDSERLFYAVRMTEGATEMDLAALRTLRADGVIVEALGPQADLALMGAIALVAELQAVALTVPEIPPAQFYVAVPLFSWRNGVGVKTASVVEALEYV